MNSESIEDYINAHSTSEPDYLSAVNRKTHLKVINPRMMSGHIQGRVLSMLCHMLKPKRILEIGAFTGYSALCMAEGLEEDGLLYTIEYDDELEEFLVENFQNSPYGKKIKLLIGDAKKLIGEIQEEFDLVFIDADKREYKTYFDEVFPKVRKGGFILADNTLWDGKVVQEVKANDEQTIKILEFNKYIADNKWVEKVILPLRDGLSLIRKL